MNKGKAGALLPIGVFLAVFIGSGIILKDFYAVPAIVGFLIALVVAFLQNPKKSFADKLNVAAKGMGNQNVMIMCLVFILAGAFSGTAQAAGGVDSVVNFALSIMPPGVAVAGLFVISAFISISMGTSVGTIAAIVPIAAGISQKTGLLGALCVGAVVSGAMFGDNLSMISDTTIAATRTQGCNLKDKFRENFKIVLPAAIATFIIFLAMTINAPTQVTSTFEYDFLKIIPYLVVLVSALLGLNVVIVLVLGIALSLGIGLFTGSILPAQMFSVIAGGADGSGGIFGMYDITVISLLVAGIIGLVKENGGIDFILYSIRRVVKTKKGAQLGIALLSSAVDLSTANNTIAIVIAGPIAKNISDEFGVSPKRTASLLDIFTSVWQGILPYGAQLLYASAGAAAVGLALTPTDIIPFLFYPVLMGVSALVWIFLGIGEKKKHKA